MKSIALFSLMAITLRMSKAEMESLRNLNNDFNEVINVEGIHACAVQCNDKCPTYTKTS